MSDFTYKILSPEMQKYMPWSAIGYSLGSIVLIVGSGLTGLYTWFIIFMLISSVFDALVNYKINSGSNYIIKNTILAKCGARLTSVGDKTPNTNIRAFLNLYFIFKFLAFTFLILLVSYFVYSLIYLETATIAVALTEAFLATVIYYMGNIVFSISSMLKYKEL